MKTESEVRERLIGKAAGDEDFRARLIADPRATVESEFQVKLPEGFSLQVHEEAASTFHLVLPPEGGRISPAELGLVAGGVHGGSDEW